MQRAQSYGLDSAAISLVATGCRGSSLFGPSVTFERVAPHSLSFFSTVDIEHRDEQIVGVVSAKGPPMR
jgi:hypothetical protein